MITDKWINNELNPIVLRDASLYIGIKYYEIDPVFLFNQTSYKGTATVGKLWKDKNVINQRSIIGYFTCPFSKKVPNLFDLDNFSIIGYKGNIRYHILNASILNETLKLGGRRFESIFKFTSTKINKQNYYRFTKKNT